MYIQQGDIFKGLSNHLIKKFMQIAHKKSYAQGDLLYHAGEPAEYFYTLIAGRIKLSFGENEHTVHIVSAAGEMFACAAFFDCPAYLASALAMEPAHLLKTSHEKFQQILAADPANQLIFFQNLARTLGNRLIQSYKLVSQPSATTQPAPKSMQSYTD
jgi:CRP-like cAMP-binding protein